MKRIAIACVLLFCSAVVAEDLINSHYKFSIEPRVRDEDVLMGVNALREGDGAFGDATDPNVTRPGVLSSLPSASNR